MLPSDYTLRVSNLPKPVSGIDYSATIKDFFSNKIIPNETLKISKVIIAHDLKHYCKL